MHRINRKSLWNYPTKSTKSRSFCKGSLTNLRRPNKPSASKMFSRALKMKKNFQSFVKKV